MHPNASPAVALKPGLTNTQSPGNGDSHSVRTRGLYVRLGLAWTGVGHSPERLPSDRHLRGLHDRTDERRRHRDATRSCHEPGRRSAPGMSWTITDRTSASTDTMRPLSSPGRRSRSLPRPSDPDIPMRWRPATCTTRASATACARPRNSAASTRAPTCWSIRRPDHKRSRSGITGSSGGRPTSSAWSTRRGCRETRISTESTRCGRGSARTSPSLVPIRTPVPRIPSFPARPRSTPPPCSAPIWMPGWAAGLRDFRTTGSSFTTRSGSRRSRSVPER